MQAWKSLRMARLTRNDLEREIDESISDGTSPSGLRSYSKSGIRAPYSSRSRDHSTEGARRGSGSRKKEKEESTL
jgi:hypothetical protein